MDVNDDIFKDLGTQGNLIDVEVDNEEDLNISTFVDNSNISSFLENDNNIKIDGLNYDAKTNTKIEKIDPLLEIEKSNKEVAENDFIKEYNKKFGTSFKDELELKQAMEKPVEKVSKLTPEQEQSFIENGKYISALENALSKSNYDILLMHNLGLEKNELGEHFDYDMAVEDIKERLNNWKNNGTLDFNANTVKDQIKSELDRLKDENKKLESIKNSEQILKEKENEEMIKNTLLDIFKEESFFGIKPEKEKINQVYNDIVSNSFSNTLSTNPKLLVELAMMYAYKEEINKRTTRPTADLGRKEILDELIPNSSKNQGLNQSRGGNTIKKDTVNGLSEFWLKE
jgi:hypothetical protein